MGSVDTVHIHLLARARTITRPGALRAAGPAPLTGTGAPDFGVFVTDHQLRRLGFLPTAALAGKPAWTLNGAAKAQVTWRRDDPGADALALADGRLATTESADVELHIYRRGALLPSHWCIVRATADPTGQIITADLIDTTWYLQERRIGYAQPRNYLDLAHWDGQIARDGLFDSTLSGWTEIGDATAEAVTDPSIDGFAPHTAKVTAPGTDVDTGMGISRFADVSHRFAAGLVYRAQAWNLSPTGQGVFFFEVPITVRYWPPGADTYDPQSEATKPFNDTLYPRDQWQLLNVDIGIPANEGGRVEVILASPATGYTFWGSRWGVFRNDNFSATPYGTGELPAHAIGRIINACKLPGDDPYRNLSSDGSSRKGKRVHFSYPDVERHSPADILTAIASDGGICWWWDVTPTARTLTAGDRSVTRWEYMVTADSPQGFLLDWAADASQARNRITYQSSDGGYSRAQQTVIAASRPGAVIDEVLTAETQQSPVSLLEAAYTRLQWRQGTPDLVTFSLPGDAITVVNVGDLFPVAVPNGSYQLLGLLRATDIRLDPVLDRVEVDAAPWVPPEDLTDA